MNIVSVKFTLDSGDVLFYDEEMCEVSEIPDQNIIVHKSQQTASTVKIYDSQYKQWQLTVDDLWWDTQSRLMQVINEVNEMVFYPHFQYDTTGYNVILVPDEVKKVYAYGGRKAMIKTTFNLLESSK